MPTLGIIAGGGNFPVTVALTAKERGYNVIGIGFLSDTDSSFPSHCDAFSWLRLGQLGKMLSFLKRHHVDEVVMAGPINKPRALDLRPDWRAARLLLNLHTKGDDILLRAVTTEIEREGMKVVAPHHFTPGLLTPSGVLTQRPPTERELSDMLLGWQISEQIGQFDIGQCLVIRAGIVLAVEAIEGTNAAIERGGSIGGPGAIVIKRRKPNQDARLDLPAAGLQTLQTMHTVGASCLVLESHASLFFDKSTALEFANRHNICILGHS